MKYTPWLLRKKERETFSQCMQISEHILGHARCLEKGLHHFMVGNFEGCKNECEKISEKQITQLRKKLTLHFAKNYMALESREDLSRIIFGFEEISSHIGATASRLTMKNISLDDYLKEKMGEMVVNIMSMLTELHRTLKLLNENLEAIPEKTYSITIMEENVDIIRRNMLKHIVNNSITDPVKLFVVAEILNSMESIADSVKNTADLLELIVVRHLP